MVGRTVQQYQFLDKLGAGGMGDIFKVQDTRLNRFVAVKVLSGERASDPERRRRFLQEAQAASALNHPNIVIIHDILNDSGNALMVMEWVQGKTLADLIPKGGLRVPQVLKYAVQMADALQVAHNAGIVHRDLKPGNIMVTDSGLVKILDFGLAKLTDRTPVSQMGIGDATQTIQEAPLTIEGSIIGTVSYMSPEQAQGRKVDNRSDIFSFGVVLYEMATGVRAFSGDSALSTLSAILRDEARPMLEIAPDVPSALENVVHRCLRKNPDDRWQSMKEIVGALMLLKRESDSGTLYGLRPVVAAAPVPASSPAGAPIPGAPVSGAPISGISAPTMQTARPASMPPPSAISSKPASSAPVIASIVGGVLFIAAAGGAWWWIKHKQAAVAPPTTPIAEITPEPLAPVADTPPAPTDQEVTNDTIIEMVQAKVPVNLILSQIRNSKTSFNLSAAEVIRLTKAGVPANVIDAMRDPKKIPATTAPPAAVATKQQPKPVSPPTVPVTQTPLPAVQATPPPPPPVQAPTVAVVQPPPVPVAPAKPATHPVTVPNGIPFPILLAEDIPASAEEGQMIHFTAADDFKVGSDVVIPKGAVITGAIAEGSKKKFIVNTKMTLRLIEGAGIAGNKIRLRATSAARPDGVSTRPVETGAKRPKDLAAAKGTEYIAYTDGEQTVPGRK